MPVGAVAGTHPAVTLLADAAELTRKAVALLAPEQVWTASAGDLDQILRSQARLDAACAAVGVRAVREADVRGLAAEDGKVSTATWLARKLGLHPAEASARVQESDILSRQGTASLDALTEGRVNPDQARALAKGLTRIEPIASAQEVADVETLLLREGIGLHAGLITRLARHAEHALDPDGKEPEFDPEDPASSADTRRAARAHRKRSLSITDLGNGLHRIRGELTDEVAALVKAALDPLAAPRPTVNGVPDERSAAQRRHDALGDIARQFLRLGETSTSHGVRPHLHVTASVQTMAGDTGHPFARTATGEDLDIATLQRIACDAGITPIVATTLGVPLAMGREVRTATPAQWAALVARDIGCIGEGCTRPAAWCGAHHLRWWDRDEGPHRHRQHGPGLLPRAPPDPTTTAQRPTATTDYVAREGLERADGCRRPPGDDPPDLGRPRVDPEQRPRRNAHGKLIRDGLKQPPDPPTPPSRPEGPSESDPDRGP